MFDPNIPGGFPSGYGGASGAETGAGGGAMSGAAGAAAGVGMVLAASQGYGPFAGFSDFLYGTFPPKRRHIEASAPRNTLSGSINKFLNEAGLGTYKTEGKMSSLQGTPATKRRKKLDKIVRAVKEKYPGYTQWQYAEMFKDVNRFMPSISIDDAIEARKQEILNPEQNPEWIRITEELKSGKIKGKGINNALAALRGIENKAASLRENPNYVPKALKAGKGSNLGFKFKGRQTDMTMEGFFKNLQRAFDNDTFLSVAGATQEQPPAQEPPTQERSLAENALNAFKGIGIGSAITRNVFNPKRLPRPDLGFGQKLFSRQY